MNKKAEGKVEGLGNVEQIREIIFGSQLREFNKRFEQMELRLTQLQEQMEERLREQQTTLQNEIANHSELTETKLKNLSTLSKEEREALRDELSRLDKRTTIAVESLGEEHETKLSLIKKEMQSAALQVKEEVEALKAAMSRELQARIGDVTEAKVSRDIMAETLFEMAMKIKGEGLDIALPETAGE